jgi:hypothetical protein
MSPLEEIVVVDRITVKGDEGVPYLCSHEDVSVNLAV